MRILVHDYSGHPFQVQLSRALAARGHHVLHLFSAAFQTPKGNLSAQPGDPVTFAVEGVHLGDVFCKDTFVRRRAQEIEIGCRIGARLKAFRPDVVLSSNAPLDTQRHILRAARAAGARFVFWLQDLYSEAIRRILPAKLPVGGVMIGAFYRWLEYTMLRRSDHVVTITDDFAPILRAGGVETSRISVVENWAPLNEIVPAERDNAWATSNMSSAGVRAVYSGTLGYKHDPALLLEAARALPHVAVCVFSEGAAASRLAADARAQAVTNLEVRPWVPFTELSLMLGGADILLAMIEEDAGVYSVPSKVLSYLAAGRPILAAVPGGNLAGRIVSTADAGRVVPPGDRVGFVEQLRQLAADATLREQLGRNGRDYAARTFDINRIADRFEPILHGVALGAAETARGRAVA